MATIPTTLAEPIRVADLPLPPEDAAELERYLRSRRLTRSERTFLEEDFKLRHHYAGHYVMATAGPEGLQIHAIDLEGPDEVNALQKSLYAQGYRHVYSLFPIPLNDSVSRIGILNMES